MSTSNNKCDTCNTEYTRDFNDNDELELRKEVENKYSEYMKVPAILLGETTTDDLFKVAFTNVCISFGHGELCCISCWKELVFEEIERLIEEYKQTGSIEEILL